MTLRFVKWLYPGMKIKRWLFLSFFGVLLFGMGSGLLLLAEAGSSVRIASLGILGFGFALLVIGISGAVPI